jgi:uncharacterized protein YoxC
MIKLSDLSIFKIFAELQINKIPGGAAYFIVEGDTIAWKLASQSFDIKSLQLGTRISKQGGAYHAMSQKKTIDEKIPRSVYGVRVQVTSTPIVNETGEIVGALSIAFPRLHPIAYRFEYFSPILAEMFPEGFFLYVTDLQKIIEKQSSRKFDIPDIKIGYTLQESDIAAKVIKSKQIKNEEIDDSVYGVPVSIVNYPLFDEDNSNEIIGTFGIVIPKKSANQLRNLSNNLQDGLSNVSSAIQQLTASASQIHTSERELNNSINEIYKLSESINEVSAFIKQVSEQSNMLGLNASIEAARAGDAGRGFNVVAQQIRKLSEQSKGAVPKIKELTDRIKEKVDITSKQSQITLQSSQEQADASGEITVGIEGLTNLSEELNKIAQNI